MHNDSQSVFRVTPSNVGRTFHKGVCPHCQTAFGTSYGKQRYCSKSCGYAARTGRQQTNEHKKKRADSVRRTLSETIRVCVVCADNFTPTQAGQTYCSGRCWNVVRNQKRIHPPRPKALVRSYAECVSGFGEACGICGAKPKPLKSGRGNGRLAVDHDHATGRIRGLPSLQYGPWFVAR